MKFHDSLSGALLLAFAIAIYWHTLGFPEIPGDPVGPALFPRIIAIGMALCAIVLIVRGLLSMGPRSWAELPDWLRMPRLVVAFLLVVLGLFAAYLFLDKLGFLVLAPLLLVALQLVLQIRAVVAIPVAIGASLMIHTIFYKGLGVPLPWGLLEAWAW
jgi:putative tricarboxylic transport membrane protein